MGYHRLIWIVVALVGCTPAPTPLPVQPIVTVTPVTTSGTANATEDSPFRYGVLPNAIEYAPIETIETIGAVVEIAQDTVTYDLMVGYGTYDGWETSTRPPVALFIDTTLPPLDDPAIASALWSAIQPTVVLQQLAIPGADTLYAPAGDDTRRLLANAGYPAGITIYGYTLDAPGVPLIVEQLAAGGFQVTTVSDPDSRVHIVLGQLDRPDAQALYKLPLSYTTAADIPLNFTDDGWPLPVR